ncbi:methyltransferase, partial [Mycobacterium sp. ITM-2017-0098]
MDRTTLHRVWRVILALLASAVAVACFFAPVLLVVIGVLL